MGGHAKQWTAAEDQAILTGLAAGLTNKAVAAQLGRTFNAVNVRVSLLRKLGTNIEAIKAAARTRKAGTRAMPPPPRPARQRDCLYCAKPFRSAGAHNRLCPVCRYRTVSPYAPGVA